MHKVVLGDCFELIKKAKDNSVDLVITSPPYSDIISYGKNVSIKKPDDYVDWILPLFKEIHRVLKPTGSFIFNINDKVEDGYRSTFVYDLISRNSRETDLKLYDSYTWWKKNGLPNGSKKRFRNSTEFIFHFCKDAKQMKFYMDRVMTQKTQSKSDKVIYPQRITDGDESKYDYVVRDAPEFVRPENVFRFLTAGSSRDNTIRHPAPFHKELPLYFINLLTDEGDIVLDPFSGIATTGVACKELNRNYIGFELNEKYHTFSEERLK